MSNTNTTLLDQLWEPAARRFPELSPREQHAGIVLFRELAGGAPVGPAQLGPALRVAPAEAEALLRRSGISSFVHADERGNALGFWGLSTVPMHHRFVIDGRTLWTWCAVDSLFLPELLGATAHVESKDPETGEPVRLTVSPDGVESAEPGEVLVSMNSPEVWELSSAARVITTACHFILFFASRASGERWTAQHSNTVLVSLDEAFEWGKRQNARAFGAELAKRSPGREPSGR